MAEEGASVSSDSKAKEEGEGREEGGGSEVVRRGGKWRKSLLRFVFPQLTLYNKKDVLSQRKSALIIGILYASHTFSAWGDRMWYFASSIFLALLYPGSLLLPGVYGLVSGLAVAIFGTVIGDWVDMTSRIKVVWQSLLIQNGLVALCAVALALMFGFQWDSCDNVIAFSILAAVVIILSSGANLATVANTISIEKDWIVVLADGNKETLAYLNANMRRIDLLCKLLAPATAGILLQHVGAFATTLIVAGWNVVSFFGELGLVWLVYRMIPTLARKKYRKPTTFAMVEYAEDEEEEEEMDDKEKGEAEEEAGKESGDVSQKTEEEEELLEDTLDLQPAPKKKKKKKKQKLVSPRRRKMAKFCGSLLTPYTSIRDGWRIYIRQEIVLVGLALASLYLTVLGFSGVTAAYFLTQGLRNDLIGIFQGAGAIFGVTGTLIYPLVRNRVGTTRAGLIGLCCQLSLLLFCAVGVVVPDSRRVSGRGEHYYSADCGAADTSPELGNLSMCILPTPTSMLPSTTPVIAATGLYSIPTVFETGYASTTPSFAVHSYMSHSNSFSMQNPTILPSAPSGSQSIVPTATSITGHSMQASSASTSTSPPFSATPESTPTLPTSTVSPVQTSPTLETTPTPTPRTLPTSTLSPVQTSPTLETTPTPPRRKRQAPRIAPSPSQVYCSPLPSPSSPAPSSESSGVSISVVLILVGVLGARTGLWMFDLSVWQLVQETVPEEERGVVSGVINAMTSLMDMLHYVLVIAAPRPEHFNILTFISVGSVTMGVILYAIHVRKVRGHFFHFTDCYKRVRGRVKQGGFTEVSQQEEGDTTCLINPAGLEGSPEREGAEKEGTSGENEEKV